MTSILTTLRVRRIDIPFRQSFKQATHVRQGSESMVVELHAEGGIVGHGECLPRSYVGGATLSGTLEALRELWRRLPRKLCGSVDELASWLGPASSDANVNNARCAVEFALLDLLGKARNQRAMDLLGSPQTTEIVYTGVIPAESPMAIGIIAAKMVSAGLASFKLKVGADKAADEAALDALRAVVGPTAEIRVDANGSWSFEQASARMEDLRKYGVVAVEQPLHPRLDSRLPELIAIAGPITIVADESIVGLSDLRRLAEAGGAHGFNIKLAKVGGIGPALELTRAAREYGLFCQLGAHVGETSLATAAGLGFATLAGDLRWHEGAFGTLLLEHDVSVSSLQFGFGGRLGPRALGDAPGLGVTVDESLLERCTTEVFDLESSDGGG